MNGRARIITLLLAFAAPCVRAETLYVIEQLIVSVNSAPDGSGERVTQIRSGDRVELLERVGDQAHVRLESGEEGWLKASYLSPDPPLREQLNARTQELERVRKENAQLEAELAKARRAAVEARAAATDPAPSNGTVPTGAGASPSGAPSQSQPAATLSPSPLAAPEATGQSPPLFEPRRSILPRPSWLGATAAALVALAVGFFLGWRTLDRRIRAKYGGLRIY